MKFYGIFLVVFVTISFVTGVIITIGENKKNLMNEETKKDKPEEAKVKAKSKDEKLTESKTKKPKDEKETKKDKKKDNEKDLKVKKDSSKNDDSKKNKKNKSAKNDNKEDSFDKPVLISSELCEETLDMPQEEEII